MKWSDINIEEEVKDELNDLSTVLNLIAQLPHKRAYRILHYCLAYIESEKPEATPTIDKLITQKIAKDIKK